MSEKDAATVANLNAKTELANIEIEKLKSQLVPFEDVVATCVSIIKPLADMLSGLPDTIERVTGAGTEVINVVSKVVDEHRLVMFEQLDGIVNGKMESHVNPVKDDFDFDIDDGEAEKVKVKKPVGYGRTIELT